MKSFKKLICLTLIFAMMAGCANEKSSQQSEETPTAKFASGTYTSTKMGNNGPITVEVTMNESGIEDILVKEHSETKGIGTTAMDMILTEMLERQTVNVDFVAGATVTSAAVKAAVSEAIGQAGDVKNLYEKEKDPVEQFEDCETELVIIGAGGAGVMAAIRASELGIKTILLEKEGIIGGTTTVVGVGFNAGGTKLQSVVTVDDYYQHLVDSGSLTDSNGNYGKESEDYTRAFADYAPAAVDYLVDCGLPIKAIEDGGNNVGSHQLISQENGKLGEVLMELLSEELKKAENVDLRLNNEATHIIMEDGKVIGVEVSGKNGSYKISAENVLIATGGYASSDEIIKEYNPSILGYNSTMCISSDGSGIKLGLEAGGVVTDMQKMTIRQLSVGYPGIGGATYAHNTLKSGEILVDANGNRFVNEQASKNDLIAALNELDKNTCYIIANQEMADGNDELAGLIKRGLMKQADTIEELAELLGMDEATLKATVDKFNESVKNGSDEEFGREDLSISLETGPYYGVEARPSRHYCNGGLITNGSTEVLNENMEAIEGLYAAGEVTWHSEHPASNALTFGRHAAEVIAEKLGK